MAFSPDFYQNIKNIDT